MSFVGRDLACIRGERVVFEGLGFTLGAGEALVIRGPNGTGKSSLLRLAAGLLRPAAGTLSWDGIDIAGDPEAHAARLWYLGHLDAVKPALTVATNLSFWAGLRGPRDSRPIAGALERFDLAHVGEAPARLLSAGQRRRLALARLAAAPAQLWCLDEPTVTLDETAVRSLIALIAKHRAEGGRVLIATHHDLDLEGADELRLGPGA